MQGFNMGRYMPPDQQESSSSSSPRRARRQKRSRRDAGPATTTSPASSSSPPGPTVRFEMPFAVWCESCPKPTLIGQGVRFNAEKRRVGSYLTTPLWSFRFRHADCGGSLEIRTDPRNTAYVVVSGGTKRWVDEGDDVGRTRASEDGLLREEKRSSAFSALERTIEHRHQLRRADERILGLLHSSARYWNDPYAQNQRLRNAFRPGRIRRQQDAASADRLRDAMGLALDILPAHDDDARLASLVSFNQEDDDDDALEKPLFTPANAPKRPLDPVPHSSSTNITTTSSSSSSSSSSAAAAAAATRASLVSELAAKTRLAQDPFLQARSQPRLRGVKRKRPDGPPPPPPPAKQATMSSALVQYDSD
ncbi:hypothetical protein CP533_3129 [Ophiocordyceps camponoti-saundersi (nom. inval.)]|nr:hypothetical protein CP533_3129 [Ophiocordyceps camponoti-saundersi (nom. inval.)]